MFKNNKTPEYLDAASTTKVDSRVVEEMLPYFTQFYGNASSNHEYGKNAKRAIDKSRDQVAQLINCFKDEIIFTSGSTEAINMALKGYVEANSHLGNHIITVKTEHKAVLATCEYLETKGIRVTYLDVDANGIIHLDSLKKAITDQTILIAIMYVNNEIGIIQPIKEIGKVAREHNIVFFSDATQAVGKVKIDVENDNIDMLCISGHKLNGPKGIGALFKRKAVALTSLIHGGGQENGLRGGTYNTPGIVGLGKACEIAKLEFDENLRLLEEKRKELAGYFEGNSIGKVNFKNTPKAPHILSITLKDENAEDFLIMKSKEFLASTGSACNSEITDKSHVMRALSLLGSSTSNILRISFSNISEDSNNKK